MRILELPPGASPGDWGRLHGETYRGEIGSLADIRVHLACKISGFAEAALLEAAAAHIDVLGSFDADLHDELLGIAAGAATTPARIVVLNHYTDLRDLRPPDDEGDTDFDGGCTMFYTRSAGTPIFAQTWDMHATAAPYAMMIRVPGGDSAAWVLSITGCLGMAGLNRAGVGIGINNLTSCDAQVGVVWPALVRRVLRERCAAEGRDRILEAPLGSGHHYLVADREAVFGIETSGQLRRVIYRGEEDPYVHANHCQDGVVADASRVPAASTTHAREAALCASLARAPVTDLDDAWRRLGSHDGYPASVCTNMATPANPHASATCAGIAIDLGTGCMYAVGGFTHNVSPEVFSLEEGS